MGIDFLDVPIIFLNKKHTHIVEKDHMGWLNFEGFFCPTLQLEKMENELGLGWLGCFDGLKDWVTVSVSNIYVLFSPAMRDMIQFD